MSNPLFPVDAIPGIDINGVIYQYTAVKDRADPFTVSIQNENATGSGYIFRETDDNCNGSTSYIRRNMMGLLSAIGGLVGLAYGGPLGAALGSGIGTLASGGDIGDALKSGIMGYGIGSLPGVSGLAAKGAGALGMQGLAGQYAAQQTAQQAALGKIAPGLMKATAPIGDAISKIGTGITAGAGGAPTASSTVGSGLSMVARW